MARAAMSLPSLSIPTKLRMVAGRVSMVVAVLVIADVAAMSIWAGRQLPGFY
jgi:hypothetical protein